MNDSVGFSEPSRSVAASTGCNTLQLDGVRLQARLAGQGPPILLLHGYPESHLAWRHIIGELSQENRVVAPDWCGWGDSERRLDLDHTFAGEVARLARLIKLLGLERATVVGHDYGGLLALGLTIRHPDLVGRLALLNTRAHRTFPHLFFLATALTCWLARTPLLWHLIRVLPLRFFHEVGFRMFMGRQHLEPAALDHYVGWLSTDVGKRWYARFFAQYQVMPHEELKKGLHHICVPTAVIWGDRDAWAPPAVARQLAQRIPGAELTWIRGGRHFILEEHPTDVVRGIKALLRRDPGLAPPPMRDLTRT